MATVITNVPPHLTINILYSDDDIIVIDKPCDLRSVPGHANERDDDENGGADSTTAPTEETVEAQSKPQRLTAQEAWVMAVRSFASGEKSDDNSTQNQIHDGDDNQTRAVDELIRNLSATSDTSSVPRKCSTFERYCQRNRRRLLPSFPELDTAPVTASGQEPPNKRQKMSYNIPTELKNIAQIAFSHIQQRQRPLMNLPTPTDDEDSAIGQLRLLGFGDYAHNNHGPPESVDDVKKRISESDDRKKESEKFKLHVVHRLDCQVSYLE
jgi:hypothetical protein